MTLLPLLLAVSASAITVRTGAVAAHGVSAVGSVGTSLGGTNHAVAGMNAAFAPTLAPALAAAADAPAPLTPAPGLNTPSAFVADREAGLVAKIAAKMPGQDSVTRGKSAAWIRDIALENPRAAVQSAAVGALADDAVAASNLVHFENVAADIEAIASSTPFDHVAEDAVARLVEAARNSGRAQRAHALNVAERIGKSGNAQRREAAAALVEGLKADPSFKLEGDELDRAAARIRAGR